jgi:hypothetical protein
MKKLIIIISLLFVNTAYSQSHRIPQRIYNYSLSYGPRGNSMYYSAGYEFSRDNTNASIGFGYGKIMTELNLFNPNRLTINGTPNEMYVGLNYVYTNKDFKWLMLVGGGGYSITGSNQILFKVGMNIRVSYPLYLTTTFYQTDRPQLMIGGKLFIF